MLTKKNEIFKQYITNGKPQTNCERFQLISNSLIKTIKSPKEKLFCILSVKLANPLLNTFVDGI